jgi:hypothetical protein
MLRWILILGGLLIVMGHHARSEALFYYFRLEDYAGGHPLKLARIRVAHPLRLSQRVGFPNVKHQEIFSLLLPGR